ncbi:hypothetical protein [Chryseobacterium jejuense]|uniref:Uncharacterized protein n=1 Tax=Chryseobacterium jejuense TaxID=445960 RepID=A0A2X2WVT6_CHRJE|nr:hypothetical protein [Chryseobacterium jejuense]SDI33046.1 hypothetical protein SAMN05421542_0859 [Chryseobacterium jejuense]SQB44848.1 Uncharacterised protein [Chryseobacterium jejuense]
MKNVKQFITAMAVVMFASGVSAQLSPKGAGSDKDKHGCKGSAGYTFSVIKNDCVRVFEQKIQLKEVDNKKSYTSNAAIILSEDGKKAELFLPSSDGSLVLDKIASKKAVTYKKGQYTLTKNKNAYTLKLANKVVFKS